MTHYGRLGIGLAIIYYLVSWVCYAGVFAGTFALLDRFAPKYLRRHRVQLEFWVAAFGALASVSLPLGLILLTEGYVHIWFGLVVVAISVFMAYRRLRERAIDIEHARGDWFGYTVSVLIWGAIYWLVHR